MGKALLTKSGFGSIQFNFRNWATGNPDTPLNGTEQVTTNLTALDFFPDLILAVVTVDDLSNPTVNQNTDVGFYSLRLNTTQYIYGGSISISVNSNNVITIIDRKRYPSFVKYSRVSLLCLKF